MPVGNALIVFFQTLDGGLAVSIAQNLFTSSLINELSRVPRIEPSTLELYGVTMIHSETPPEILQAVLETLSHALSQAFVLPIIGSGLAFVSSIAMEWKTVRKADVPGGQLNSQSDWNVGDPMMTAKSYAIAAPRRISRLLITRAHQQLPSGTMGAQRLWKTSIKMCIVYLKLVFVLLLVRVRLLMSQIRYTRCIWWHCRWLPWCNSEYANIVTYEILVPFREMRPQCKDETLF